MTEAGAMRLLSVVGVDRQRDADPALARLWAHALPDVPDQAVGEIALRLLREGTQTGRFPAACDVLAAWRAVRSERVAAERQALARAERDSLPVLSEAEVAENLRRVRVLLDQAQPKRIEAAS